MEYKDLEKANAEISFIDVKGKNYADVANRVNAFRKLFPNGSITTEIISNDAGVCIIKATCFDEHEKRPCRRPKHRAQNNSRNAISMIIMAWRKGKVNDFL